MHRKIKTIALAAALLATAGGVAAQDFVFGWNPRSGDVWVDRQLSDINQYGNRYRDPFIDEMNRYYGAPRDLVSDLLVKRRWAPGDIYYACAIAQVTGQPCRAVVDQWDRDHGQGWGAIAQRMGIKPGSPEFHRLKKGFVPTYDRWARPIAIDDDLRTDFPGRGKGPKHAALLGQPGKAGKSMHGDDKGHSGGHGKARAKGAKPAEDHGDKSGHGNQAMGKSGKEHGGGKGKSKGRGKD